MRTAVLIALALALTTAACGRKGPLEPAMAPTQPAASQTAAAPGALVNQ